MAQAANQALTDIPVYGEGSQGLFSQERRGLRRQNRGEGLSSGLFEGIFGPDQILGGEPRQIDTLQETNPYTEDIVALLEQLASQEGAPYQQGMMDIGQYGWDQFASRAPELYGMTMDPTSQFSQGQTALAQRNASLGIEQAMNQMSGLGSLYSGATLDAGNRAAQDAYLQATNATNQFGAGLLGGLWGQALPAGYGAGGQMAGIGAGLYGLGVGGLTGYGDPMFRDPSIGGMGSEFLATVLKGLSLG